MGNSPNLGVMHVTIFRFASTCVGRVSFYLHPARGVNADVAQLVEHHLAKVRVAGSSPVIRSGDWRSGSALP